MEREDKIGPRHRQVFSRGMWASIAFLLGMVLIRGVPHLVYPEVFFDSDQAMIGIMGKDLLVGRSFPWTFYGQKYLLAVESWAAAGSFALFGVSPWSLKFPLLLINGAVAAVLFFILRRDVRFSSREALAVASLVAMPSFVEGAYLMGAQGGTVWPLLYVLLGWLLAARPVLLGLFLGVTYFHREFVLFAFVALVCLDLMFSRGAALRLALKSRLSTLLIAFAVYHAMIGVGQFSAQFFGPGSPKMKMGGPPMVLDNIAFFLKVQVPALFGVGAAESVRPFEVQSDVLTAPAVWGPLNALGLGALLLAGLWTLKDRRAVIGRSPHGQFLIYLALVGAGQIAAYLLFVSSQEPVLIRYIVMAPFLLVGILGLLLYWSKASRGSFLGRCTIGLLLSLGLANLTQTVAFSLEQSSQTHVSSRRQLAQYLVEHGYRWGWAPYWEAYHLTFITDETLIVASSDHTRVRRYLEEVAAHPDSAFVLTPSGMCDDPQAPMVEGWQICPFRHYRGEIAALTKGA